MRTGGAHDAPHLASQRNVGRNKRLLYIRVQTDDVGVLVAIALAAAAQNNLSTSMSALSCNSCQQAR